MKLFNLYATVYDDQVRQMRPGTPPVIVRGQTVRLCEPSNARPLPLDEAEREAGYLRVQPGIVGVEILAVQAESE